MKLHPILMRSPEALVELADRAQHLGNTTSERLTTLVRHFFNTGCKVPDLSGFPYDSPSKAFTLRFTREDLKLLKGFSQSKLYTRQQAVHVAVFSSLLDMGLTQK